MKNRICSSYNRVIEVNQIQRALYFEKLLSVFGSVKGRTISILGLASKRHTDDMRESAAIDMIEFLLQHHQPVSEGMVFIRVNEDQNPAHCDSVPI